MFRQMRPRGQYASGPPDRPPEIPFTAVALTRRRVIREAQRPAHGPGAWLPREGHERIKWTVIRRRAPQRRMRATADVSADIVPIAVPAIVEILQGRWHETAGSQPALAGVATAGQSRLPGTPSKRDSRCCDAQRSPAKACSIVRAFHSCAHHTMRGRRLLHCVPNAGKRR